MNNNFKGEGKGGTFGDGLNTVYTVTANCQDCYRCVRACPVKAIRVTGGQAYVVDSLCIKCGTCVRECPQKAKTIKSSLDTVKAFIENDETVAASVAPSFAAAYTGWKQTRFPSALRMLGFTYVTETAEGADAITQESFKEHKGCSVCTACPAVVNYVEMYRPEYLSKMIPVVSPMVAHGRMLKKRYGEDCKVVFIGPCAAKKSEAERPENADSIDAVLTFKELDEWLAGEGLNFDEFPESEFAPVELNDDARYFPIDGGMLKTAGKNDSNTDKKILHLSGAEEVMDLFSMKPDDWRFNLVEPLFCHGGCINGPAFPEGNNVFERRNALIDYAEKHRKYTLETEAGEGADLKAHFSLHENLINEEEVSESLINEILASTGKLEPEDRLNCGACGYSSCVENAIAVAKGLAEPGMCMPYMRRMAQQRSDRIIETSPSGTVILDEELNIISMNPAFQHMFNCNNSILGKRISYLLNADNYEMMQSGSIDKSESIQTRYGIKYHEVAYALKEEKQYVGIYSDISKIKFDRVQLDLIKSQTLNHAKDVLDHQLSFSQEMAHFLGKSTARTEELVKRLMDLYDAEEGGEK